MYLLKLIDFIYLTFIWPEKSVIEIKEKSLFQVSPGQGRQQRITVVDIKQTFNNEIEDHIYGDEQRQLTECKCKVKS